MKRAFRIARLFDHPSLPIILIILAGAILRFYKLDWGQGLFAHPDEYHIVISALQLKFPEQMNPHFFSYGTVVIYLIYFSSELLKFLSSLPILNSEFLILNPFLIGRFYSALFSTLTVLLCYRIGQLIFKKPWPLVFSFLVALTPGLIQQAHFATPESALIFFLFGSLLFILKFTRKARLKYLILSSIFLGLGLGVKISAIPLGLVIVLAVVSKYRRAPKKIAAYLMLSGIAILASLAVGAPFVFLDFPDFRGNITYEGGLAAGQFTVFYTRQFIYTVPILFQLDKIFPYALGISVMILGIVGFGAALSSLVKKADITLAIIVLAFLTIFIPNAYLLAKWTRFVSPTFPFWALFSTYMLAKFYRESPRLVTILTILLVFSSTIWCLMFFSIYTRDDVRLTASQWLQGHLRPNTTILVEGGNTVDLPVSGGPYRRISLDFYNLEQDPNSRQQITQALEQSDYFIIESRRVFANHQRLPNLFPITASFYKHLFNQDFGFVPVATFTSFPTLLLPSGQSLVIDDEGAEETWSVFDHPVIRVFQKKEPKSEQDYFRIWQTS